MKRPARDADEEEILSYLHMDLGIPVPLLQAELAAFRAGHEVPKYLCRHGVAAHWCQQCNPTTTNAADATTVRRARNQRGRET